MVGTNALYLPAPILLHLNLNTYSYDYCSKGRELGELATGSEMLLLRSDTHHIHQPFVGQSLS